MAKANGAYLYDKDGNRYIDFLQAGGPTILGSNYPVIREKVIELLNECGPVTGLLHESELMIARRSTGTCRMWRCSACSAAARNP